MKVRHALWIGALFLAVAVAAHAQSTYGGVDPYEEFGKRLKAAQEVTPLSSDLFGDSVSLYNGATEFNTVDISIPGNSALQVELRRRRVIEDQRLDGGSWIGGFGDWDADVPYIAGTFTDANGWQLSNGSYNRCSDTVDYLNTTVPIPGGSTPTGTAPYAQVWSGNQMHIPGGGDEELLVNNQPKSPAYASASGYPWITKGNYRISCLGSVQNGLAGEGFVAVSPSGVSYTFNWAVTKAAPAIAWAYSTTVNPVPVLRDKIYLLATHVQDRFGNWVNYSYSGSHLTQITSSDGRTITLTWNGDTIQSVTSPLGTWQYTYVTGSNGLPQLSSVTLPDGSQWTYAVVSGTLRTTKNEWPNGPQDPHPKSYCQYQPTSNSGSFVYSIGAPSGASATYDFEYQRRYRDSVPWSCIGNGNSLQQYPWVVDFLDNFALVTKTVSGAGLPAEKWTYQDNSAPSGDYYTPTTAWSYNNNAQPYVPSGSCTGCALSKVVVVTSPTTITKYTFGVQYARNEGQLLSTEVDDLSGNPLKTTSNIVMSTGDAANATFPGIAGQSELPNYSSPLSNQVLPVTQTTTAQDGDTYTLQNEAFDAFARTTRAKRFNNIAGQSSIEEQTAYLDDLSLWVLGLPQERDNLTTGEVESKFSYTSGTDTLYQSWRFGELLKTYSFNAQGQLASFTDGNSHTTSLSNYKRGEPQLINFPDQTSESLVLDDAGRITSVTDQAGHTTGYSYDAMGRISRIDYPGGDEQAWYPKTFTYAYVTSAERGIAANHWRRTITTGNDSEVTWFDAMLRPLLTDTSIIGSAGSDITTAKAFDSRGLTTFASYPVGGAPDLSAITTGTHETYDALGRLTQSQQDSELGTLTSTTAYLSGARQQVTDPKGNVTTTSYQVFDQPSYDAVTQVQAPAGITQTITRDLYGNPLSITQSGLYGTESDSVTKTLTYDGYHRLCRTTEPESGSTVMAYDSANNLVWSAQGLAITGTGCGQEQVAAAAQTLRSYDAMNRLLTIAPPSGTQSTQYTYDALGQATHVVSGTSVWDGSYNYRGMLTGETLQLSGQSPWTIGYSHDAYGHLATVSYPAGTGTSEAVAYVPDALGRATQVGSYAGNISYFPNGAVAGFTYGNGAGYVAEQNARQLLRNFSYGVGSTLNLSEDYGYDADGNITTVTDLAGGPRSKSFSYDALNRLTNAQANGLWGTEAYTYDPLNNLRTRLSAGQTLTYNYDATNKLTSLTNGASTVDSFLYDNRGNVTGKNGMSLLFDQQNQLTQAVGYDSYAYDASGRRVTKTPASGGASTYYFYDHAGQLMYQYAPGSAQSTNFIYLGSKLIARNVSVQLAAPGAISFDANPNNGSYTVSWGAALGATSYTLQESANGGAWVTVSSGSGTSATFSGKAGGSYVYRVQGCSSSCGYWTTSATLGVRPALPAVTVPGGTVNGAYTVSWSAPAGATSYDVQERVGTGAWTTIASSTTATSISRPGTTSGSYTYQVSAKNVYGSRGWALSGAVTVDATTPPASAPALSVPASSGTGSYTVSWGTVGTATSYTLQEQVNGGSWTTLQSSSATSLAISGKGNGSYGYHVQACNASGCGPWSATASTTVLLPPAAPASITVPASSTGSIAVSWAASSTASSYTLQQSLNGGSWSSVYSGAATSSTLTVTASGSYTYQVQACNSGGCSAFKASTAVA
ncbi:MAG: hypothetical protein KGJ32_14330, partial [Xanthomonadaceae bacterium]|nr:hypothetical protein [Xanthomonadaceae bacterium]